MTRSEIEAVSGNKIFPTDTKLLPSVFTEMLQSLIIMGETQNLSQAVTALGVSRQTIRRHIRELESLTDSEFFESGNRQYNLTKKGELAVSEAQKLINLSNDWVAGNLSTPFELFSKEIEINGDSWMYAQQHPLIKVFSMAPPILQRGAESWIEAQGELSHQAFDKIRPYILVYRKYRNEWLIVEVGEKSAYGTWLGISLAKSEVGRKVDLGAQYEPMVAYWRKPYEAVQHNGGFWYEHISVSMPRHAGGEPIPVHYQRLVAACKFADGQPAIMVFAARTDRIEIPNMPASRFMKNKPENLMEFDI